MSQLTLLIRRALEQHVGQVWVTGEITNLRLQSSGHIYFTLKDASAQLNCVLFRGETQVQRALLQEGRCVVVQGDLTVYEPRGQYQLRVVAVELQGIGALQAAFEKLKQKLNAEGLFAPERKRPLPRFPQRIGVVTSPTGAAIRDVLHVVGRRNRSLELILAPCRVQGTGAAGEIAQAIRWLNEFHRQQLSARQSWSGFTPDSNQPYLDAILVTRGGGSLEDLWAFNEEAVARAIFESGVPVVSAVGHEIDFTISDFVADLRAATPSAAAEILTEGVFSSCEYLASAGVKLQRLVRQRMENRTDALARLAQRLARQQPRRRLQEQMQRLDETQSSLARCVRQGLRRHQIGWESLVDRLARVRPAALLKHRRELLHQETRRLYEQMHHQVERWQNLVEQLHVRLRLLGPQHVLGRGYSITTSLNNGAVVRHPGEVAPGQCLRTRLAHGELISRVESVES